jgi:hypothetical protein
MKKSDVRYRQKRRGQVMLKVNLKAEPEMWQALTEKSEQMTEWYGRKVSLVTVIRTALYSQFPKMEERVEQLKRENLNDREEK